MQTPIPTSGPYAAVHALLASPLPIPPDAPPRAVLAAQIDHLIDLLDAFDAATEDLEPDADLEPWLAGSYTDRGQDLELEEAEDEPSLGSLDGRFDQTNWAGGGVRDLELEHDGREPDEADHEPSLGWSNPMAPRIIGQQYTGGMLLSSTMRLEEERVPTVRVIRPRSAVRA